MACLKWVWFTLLVLLIFSFQVSGYVGEGDGLNISVNRTGSNFILWRWDLNESSSAPNLTKTIFINQVKVVDNTTLGYYLLTDINPDEEHIIEVQGYNTTINSLNTTKTSTQKTYEQNLWMPLLIGCGLVVVGWFTAPILILPAFPVFLYGFTMARDLTNQSYIILTYGLGAILVLFIFAARYNK